MSTRATWSVLVVVAGLLFIGGAVAAQDAAPQAWLHVQITGEDEGAENVSVNVPLSAAEPMLALVPHRILSDGSSVWPGAMCRSTSRPCVISGARSPRSATRSS